MTKGFNWLCLRYVRSLNNEAGRGGGIAKFLFFSRKEILLEYVYLLYSAVCVPIVRPHVYMMRERANSSLSLTT